MSVLTVVSRLQRLRSLGSWGIRLRAADQGGVVILSSKMQCTLQNLLVKRHLRPREDWRLQEFKLLLLCTPKKLLCKAA